MLLINKKIFFILKIVALLLTFTMIGCTSVPPHTGCYVADPHLRGKYAGECKAGKAHGRGKSMGRDIYEGEFAEGVLNGQGTYIWSDGDRYIGQFKEGKAHGRGVMKYRDGAEKAGVWKNNRLEK